MQEHHPTLKRGFARWLFPILLLAIIAMLADLAVPVLNRSLLENKASACKQDLRALDIAIAQWAAENDKRPGDPVNLADLQAYLGTADPALRERGEDSLGHSIPFDGNGPHVPAATKAATKEVVGDAFWAAYN